MKIGSNITFGANKMTSSQAQYLNNNFKKAKSIDIICHETSDKDSANSALVMQEYLENLGINTRIIISQNLETLRIQQNEKIVQSNNLKEVEKQKPDAILCVDFSKTDRIPAKVFNHVMKNENIFGIDHHNDLNIVDSDYIHIKKPIEDLKAIDSVGSFYIDSSAKSATSIVFRFLEAMNEEIDSNTAYKLFLGLADDCVKKGLIECDGKNGTITPKENFLKDENAKEVYEKLREKLNDKQISDIAQHIDILSFLTPIETRFLNELDEKLKFSENKKIAYVEISPNDEQWIKLGRDNARTSTILNRYRQKVLKETDANVVFAFYEAGGNYRFSAHAKDDSLLEFFKYVDENSMKGFFKNSGGHPSRGGGKIQTTDEKACHSWVSKIISCEKFYN